MGLTSAEKNFLRLALFLFALGMVSRMGFLNRLSPLEAVSLPMNPEFSEAAMNPEFSEAALPAAEGDSLAAFLEKKEKKAKAQKKKPAFPININTASEEDLCFIKGVGPSMAKKIIAHRESKGDFRAAKELEKIPGIGAKKRAAMEEFIRFE